MNPYSVLRHCEESYRCLMDREVDSEDSTRLPDENETIGCSGSCENRGTTPACPQTRIVAHPIPRWLTEPGMMREEVARRSEGMRSNW